MVQLSLPNGGRFLDHPTPEACAEALADAVSARLRDDIGSRGNATLVVSGGSTPAPFFRALSDRDLDWAKVTVVLADERWVPPDHADSNEALVRQHLVTGKASSARVVGLWRATSTPEQAVSNVTAAIRGLVRPFSAVVLGMGLDGHTASLFPGGAPELLAPDSPLLVTAAHATNAPHPRITLTVRALAQTEATMLHVIGQAKRDVLARALERGGGRLPIRAVLDASRVDVYYAS